MSIIGRLYRQVSGNNLNEILANKKAKVQEKLEDVKNLIEYGINEKQKKEKLKQEEDQQVILEFNDKTEAAEETKEAEAAEVTKEAEAAEDLTESLLSSLDEDGFLATGGGCGACPAGFEAFEKNYGELKQFFESLPSHGAIGGTNYRLDEYGRALAGVDGKISKEELMQLDMDGDGKITQEDIDNFKADLDKKKASDLYTYIDCSPEGKLSNIRSYLSTNEVRHEQLLLSNLYDEITKDDLTDPFGMTAVYIDGTVIGTIDGVRLDSAHKNYKLNEFGKAIAGEDGAITKEGLSKLDMDGDGKITQEDIDKFKADLNEKKASDLYTYIDYNSEGKLANIRSYSSTDEAQNEQLLLSNLYDEITEDELKASPAGRETLRDDITIGVIDGVQLDSHHKNYALNELGKDIAGEDNVITKEELSKLDMDGDNKITQKDIDTYKEEINKQEEPVINNTIQTQLKQFINMIFKIFMMLFNNGLNTTTSAADQEILLEALNIMQVATEQE